MNQNTFYNFNGQEYTQNGLIVIDGNCNGLNVINTGTSVCFVNGIPLNPPAVGESVGDSYSIGGNKGEILQGRVNLTFVNNLGKAIVVQKFYLEL